MRLRRKIEQVDEDGRRRTVITEEPLPEDENEEHQNTEMVEEEEVAQAHAGPWTVARAWVRTMGLWVMLAAVVVEALLAFRLGFLLAGANPNNRFVDFIYDITGPMVEPFQGIASQRAVDGGTFEPATAIAMGIYLVAALLLVAALWILTAGPSSGERVVTTRRHQHESAVREH